MPFCVNVKQIANENYVDFSTRLQDVVQKMVSPPDLGNMLLHAFGNANAEC